MLTRRTFLQSALFLPAALASPAHAQQTASGTVPAQTASATEVFADFEGGNYDGWTIEGNAFGSAPATDALFPGKISGFTGRGFLCSLHPKKGNVATGKAISREFTITKPFITFKIGGGSHPNEACMNLVVDNQIVHTATGYDLPALSEALWDVSALVGKKAHLEVVDSTASPQRGYILIDDIQFTNGIIPRQQEKLELLANGLGHDFELPGVWGAVWSDGRVSGQYAAGYASLEEKRLATVNTLITYGSISKAMTGFLTCIMVYKNVIQWSTTIRQMLPEMIGKIRPELLDVTVELLVTHRAGLRNGPLKWPETGETPSKSRYLYVQNLLDSPMVGQPGEKSSYAPGVEVVGVMLERLTGKTLETLFKQEVFDRYGMNSCMLGDPYTFDKKADAPWGYSTDSSGRHTLASTKPMGPGYACGGISGTITDVVRWFAALANGYDQGGNGLSKLFYETVLAVPNNSHHTYSGLQPNSHSRFSHDGATSRGMAYGIVDIKSDKSIVLASNLVGHKMVLPACQDRCYKWLDE